MTELQCDLVALAWIRLNASALRLADTDLEDIRADLASLARSRFEGRDAPEELLALFNADAGRASDRDRTASPATSE